MKKVILDSGPIISLALNRLLWVFEKVKKEHQIEFYITPQVKREIVDNPLHSRRFKLEALQVEQLIKNGTFQIFDHKDLRSITDYLLECANSVYSAKERNIRIVHLAEITVLAASLLQKADAVMIDERSTRYLAEKPQKLRNILHHRLHTKVTINQEFLKKVKAQTENIKIIRSTEFIAIAFEKGMFDHLLRKVSNAKEELLDALLWGLKLQGCAISEKDLETLKREELKQVQ